MAGWGSQQWLKLTEEATFGTYATGGSVIWIRLPSDTAFMMQADPKRGVIRSADGGNRPVQNISVRTDVAGSLKTLLYPTQASALLTWATVLTANDLGSYTADWYDTIEVRRYTGVKVETMDIESAVESTEGALSISFGLVGQSAGTATLTQPAFSVYPTEQPYNHTESIGGLTISGGATQRTLYKSWKMSLKNILAKSFEESASVSNITYCGRDITLSADFQYRAATDNAAYEGQTTQTASIVFTKSSPGHVLTLNTETAAVITKRTRTIPLRDISRQSLDLQVFYDSANSTDFTFTAT